MKNLTYTLLTIALLHTGFMQAQLSLEGEFRPRSEYFGNGGNYTGGSFPAGTATVADEGFVRTTVRAAFKTKYKAETYTLFTSFQEVFAFGDRQQIATAGNGNFRVQEAWADLLLGESSSLKVGRQPLSYDNQRILGGLGWAQQARTHDAVVYKYKKDKLSLDIGGSLNTTTDEVYNNSTLFTYRDMLFLRLNHKGEKFNVSFLTLSNTYQNSNVDGATKSNLTTYGLHMGYKAGALSLTSDLYMQEGERIGGVDVKGAYLASLGLTYKLDKTNSLGLSYEVISGKESDTAAFFPLYGTNHAFNGLMDRFYVGNHANAGGLKDLKLTYKTKISGVALTVAAHSFTEQSQGGDDLGTEIDLILAKKFKEFVLVGGYSHFIEPSAVADLANVKDTQNWAWLMLVLKPKFLN